jgi:hypothetical protein
VERGRVGAWEQTLTITNTTEQTLSGPLALVLSGLPADVSLSNASGSWQGSPYLDVVGLLLPPGRKVRITLSFSIPDGALNDLAYTIQALMGI